MTAHARRDRPSAVFASIAAQEDNLGDILIRRTLLGWVAPGAHLHVFTGTMSKSHIDAYQFRSNVRLTSRAIRFELAFVGSCFRQPTFFTLAPGPTTISDRPRDLVKVIANWINFQLARASGGGTIAVGKSYKVTGRVARSLVRSVVRHSRIATSRDTISDTAVGPISSTPDLGLYEVVRPSDQARPTVAICLRGDRPVPQNFIGAIAIAAEKRGQRVVFVTQVQRDARAHRDLAHAFGCDLVDWTIESHTRQLELVTEAYARASHVITDRLHGAIMAMNAGARPIALVRGGEDKLVSTLSRYVALPEVTPLSDIGDILTGLQQATGVRDEAAVRKELTDLRSRILETVLRPHVTRAGGPA